MTMADGYEVEGQDGTFILVDRRTGHVAGAFYAEENEPGWWRGHVHGRVRRLFVPAAEPLEVAARFLR